ncbi:hypothetical protein CBOM_00779 [Ceraceosorus bombacis]|uniref:Uncharacterized protein n=1 Tax=Ceraceosorus bombacis TaxID=401625 RepID=A0A0P1BBR8_9BASI|nr:hypothetical protein CBOM_00779 [Ceraceosorus bombacis]
MKQGISRRIVPLLTMQEDAYRSRSAEKRQLGLAILASTNSLFRGQMASGTMDASAFVDVRRATLVTG